MVRILVGAAAGLLCGSVMAVAADPRPFADLRVEAVLPVFGGYLAATEDAVWTFSQPKMVLIRIDAASGAISETTLPGYVGFQYPFAVAEGAVWVPDLGTSSVVKADAATGNELLVVGDKHMSSNGAAVLDGSLWIGAHVDFEPMVIRYDAATGAEQARIPTSEPIFNLIGAGGYVWVNRLRRLTRIDPATNTFVGGAPAGEYDYPMWTGEGFLWVQSFDGDMLSQIDPQSGVVVKEIDLGNESAARIAVGGGNVWLATQANQLLQVDIASGTVVGRYVEGPYATGIAFAGGSLWILAAGPEEIWRIEPPK